MTDSIVQLCTAAGARTGFGVIVGARQILTLHHVIAAAVYERKTHPIEPRHYKALRLKGSKNEAVVAEVRSIDSVRAGGDKSSGYSFDAATIELDRDAFCERQICALVDVDVERERAAHPAGAFEVEFYGVPANAGLENPVALMHGLANHALSADQWQFVPRPGEPPMIEGTSGAPVFDVRKRRLLGLVQWRAGETPVCAYVSKVRHLVDQLTATFSGLAMPIVYADHVNPRLLSSATAYLDRIEAAARDWRNDINKRRTVDVDYQMCLLASSSEADEVLRGELKETYRDDARYRSPDRWLQGIAQARSGGLWLLQARGGAGKSNLLAAILLACRRHRIIPFLLRASDLLNERLRHRLTEEAGREEQIAALGEAAFDSGGVFEQVRSKDGCLALFMIDGMNEYPEARKRLLAAAQVLMNRAPWIAVLATERPATTAPPPGAHLMTVAPLPREQILRTLRAHDIAERASEEWLRFLSLPFALFLDVELLGDVLGQRREGLSRFIERYFHNILNQGQRVLWPSESIAAFLKALSSFAFKKYERRAREFTIEELREAVSRAVAPSSPKQKRMLTAQLACIHETALIATSIASPADGSSPTLMSFRHQLLHDYLAALHVATSDAQWTDLGFDAITWKAEDTETLQMVVEILPEAGADLFLRRLYDWNFRAMAQAVDRLQVLSLTRGGCVAPRLRDRFAALFAMKLRDPFDATRNDMRALIPRLDCVLGEMALDLDRQFAEDRDFNERLQRRVGERFAASSDLQERRWCELFVSAGLPRVPDGSLLASADALLGWSAANVYRREATLARCAGDPGRTDFFLALLPTIGVVSELAQMQRAQSADDRRHERLTLSYRVTLRRVVYVLGAADDERIAQTLLGIVLADEAAAGSMGQTARPLWKDPFYDLVRDDALRSLLEMAARNDGDVRAQIHDRLIEGAAHLDHKPRQRIAKSLDIQASIIASPEGWHGFCADLRRHLPVASRASVSAPSA